MINKTYIAVVSKSKVLEVVSSELCATEGLLFYTKLGYKKLTKFVTSAENFMRYSDGEDLTVNVKYDNNGENLRLVVAA
jgi:hypothetical protein